MESDTLWKKINMYLTDDDFFKKISVIDLEKINNLLKTTSGEDGEESRIINLIKKIPDTDSKDYIIIDTLNILSTRINNEHFHSLYDALRHVFKSAHLLFIMKYHFKRQEKNWLDMATELSNKDANFSFLIGNNGEAICSPTGLRCPSKNCTDHAACGYDDFLVIAAYNALIKCNKLSKVSVYLFSDDKYRDYKDLHNTFKTKHDVKLIGNPFPNCIDFLNLLFTDPFIKPAYKDYVTRIGQ